MAEFAYVAVDESGKQKKGIIEASNIDQARTNLKGQGLTPITVDVPSALNKEISINIGGKVGSGDLALLCKQFQSILHAGVTVIQALSMLEDQAENKKLHEALTEVRTLVEKGDTLAGAMGTRDDVFPKILIHMVEAGETSGSLETSLERMAVHFEKDSKIKSMVTQAMIYPVVLLVVIIAVVILMLVKVVPSFQETFDAAGGQLPAITLAVVALSKLLIHRWYIFAGVVAGIVFGIRIFMKTESGAQFFGRLIIKLPVFGDLVIKQACARLARTMSTLLASGISMVGAIEIVAKIMSNRIVQVVIEDAKEEVERGVPLSQPLEQSGVFPPLLCHMTQIGEETGNLEEMLEKVADYYDEEVERATQAVSAIMEPLIIVLMAGLVVPIMLAIMAPMLSIYSMAENS